MNSSLKLSFDPLTIEHLGVKMYSHLPNAVAELVANAYDAEAHNIRVDVEMLQGQQVLRVVDDGHGMSIDDLANKYLRIGRNRREARSDGKSENGIRKVSGKKGLGKLALFGIAQTVVVRTSRKDSGEMSTLSMNWRDLMASTGGDYYPNVAVGHSAEDQQGTTITLTDLKRVTTIDPEALAASLSTLFNYADDDVKIEIVGPDGKIYPVHRDRRLDAVKSESEWRIPDDIPAIDRFFVDNGIVGRVVSSETPLRNNMRGVTLYSHGRMVNEPEFFGAAESSFAYSYLTGYIDVDFIDSIEPDVIATDRRAVSWETQEMQKLQEELRKLLTLVASERRAKRKEVKKKKVESSLPIPMNDWVASVNGPERKPLEQILEVLASPDVELGISEQATIVSSLEEIAPPYADLHWRHLHPSIQESAQEEYKRQNYYSAVEESLKRYVHDVRRLSGVGGDRDVDLMFSAFGENENAKIRVFAKYSAMSDYAFSESTRKNIEAGQQFLSVGLVRGFRNPLAHEEKIHLRDSGAFTYVDCLDALSILSHLRRRLDDASAVSSNSSL